jgi:hypothetical protein
MLDSGCSLSVLPAPFYHGALQQKNVKLYAANESQISVLGETRVHFTVGDLQLFADVLVSDSVDEFLLGFDWLQVNQCIWLFADGVIHVRGHALKLNKRRASNCIRRVYVADNVLVEKYSVAYVPVTLAFASLRTKPSNWLLEPRVANNCLLVARALFDDTQNSVIRVYNPSSEGVTIK